jgi:hypothetical protein
VGQRGLGAVHLAKQVDLDHAGELGGGGVVEPRDQQDAGHLPQVSSRPYSATARSATSDMSPGSPRAATTTLAPCSAKRRAVARPMPLEAPITTTT